MLFVFLNECSFLCVCVCVCVCVCPSLSLFAMSCYIVDGAWAADILLIDPRLPLCLFRLMKNDSSALIEFYSFLTWSILRGAPSIFGLTRRFVYQGLYAGNVLEDVSFYEPDQSWCNRRGGGSGRETHERLRAEFKYVLFLFFFLYRCCSCSPPHAVTMGPVYNLKLCTWPAATHSRCVWMCCRLVGTRRPEAAGGK